jgi:hypothetical protein
MKYFLSGVDMGATPNLQRFDRPGSIHEFRKDTKAATRQRAAKKRLVGEASLPRGAKAGACSGGYPDRLLCGKMQMD